MAQDDPNLDPSWSWNSKDYQLLYSSAVGESPASENSALLPFYASGNILKIDPPDVEAQDGWQLMHRDFGIKSDGQAFPFFTLSHSTHPEQRRSTHIRHWR